jgi:hypothetical protein
MQNDAATATGKTPTSRRTALVSALKDVEVPTWAAISLIFVGWFLLDTLRVDWGPLQHHIAFYQMAAVIGSPVRLFTGVERYGLGTALFVLLCCATALAPAAPYLRRHRFAWIGGTAPLILMVLCAIFVQARVSGDIFPAHGALADTLSNDLRHLASHLLGNASASASRHVSFVSGGYLSLLASLYLSARALKGFPFHPDRSDPG